MADIKNLAETLVSLTVKEVQELADVLKADYGIEPAAVAAAVAGGGRCSSSGRRENSIHCCLEKQLVQQN
jgi:large subunit ribosomal protein L7/L12